MMKKLFNRLWSAVCHPGQYFLDDDALIWDGVVVVFALVVVSFFQKLVWVDPYSGVSTLGKAVQNASLNNLLIWALFCVFFFALAGAFRRVVNLPRLCGQVGVAGLPLIGTTLVSALLWVTASALRLDTTSSSWWLVQSGLNWLGLALSWPGVYGYFLFRNALKLSQLWSIILIVLAFAFLVGAKILPLL